MNPDEWERYLNWTDPKQSDLDPMRGIFGCAIVGALCWVALALLWVAVKAVRVYW